MGYYSTDEGKGQYDTACAIGTFSTTAGGACDPCADGKYCFGGEEIDCPEGYYCVTADTETAATDSGLDL